MTLARDDETPVDFVNVFDQGPSPVDGGADFACSWSGESTGQIIVRSNVLHINAGEQSAAIPAERLHGWTSREHDGHVELTIDSHEDLHIRVPAELFLTVERVLQGLR